MIRRWRWNRPSAIAGSAQRCRVRSSVSWTPGENFAKRSSTPSLKKNARSWCRSTIARGDRRVAGAQGHDLALAGGGERLRRATNEGGVAFVLDQRGAARPFQPLASSARNISVAARPHQACAPPRRRPGRGRRAGCAGGAAPSASWPRAPHAATRRHRASRRGRRGHAIAARAGAGRRAPARR